MRSPRGGEPLRPPPPQSSELDDLLLGAPPRPPPAYGGDYGGSSVGKKTEDIGKKLKSWGLDAMKAMGLDEDSRAEAKRKALISKKSFELADYVRKKIGNVGSGKDYYQSGR